MLENVAISNQKIQSCFLGHDVMGFDMEVLLHRTILNKIPNWSRLGRLKRSQPLKGRMSERIATTGRLVCDLKISAKELIRCKSYDLGALIEKLLGKPQENRMEVDVEMMRKAYGSSKALIEVTSHCLQDAADTLKVIFHSLKIHFQKIVIVLDSTNKTTSFKFPLVFRGGLRIP